MSGNPQAITGQMCDKCKATTKALREFLDLLEAGDKGGHSVFQALYYETVRRSLIAVEKVPVEHQPKVILDGFAKELALQFKPIADLMSMPTAGRAA